jgi:hypothetical protein
MNGCILKQPQVVKRRNKVFAKQGLPRTIIEELTDGLTGISGNRSPLCAGTFGLVIAKSRLLVAKGTRFSVGLLLSFSLFFSVLTLYSQGGGKNAAHAWQEETRSIGAISYLGVQVFEPAFRSRFRAIHSDATALQLYTFAHLSSDFFLRILPGSQTLSQDLRTLELNISAYEIYDAYSRYLLQLLAAVKCLQVLSRNPNSKKWGLAAEEEDMEGLGEN